MQLPAFGRLLCSPRLHDTLFFRKSRDTWGAGAPKSSPGSVLVFDEGRTGFIYMPSGHTTSEICCTYLVDPRDCGAPVPCCSLQMSLRACKRDAGRPFLDLMTSSICCNSFPSTSLVGPFSSDFLQAAASSDKPFFNVYIHLSSYQSIYGDICRTIVYLSIYLSIDPSLCTCIST